MYRQIRCQMSSLKQAIHGGALLSTLGFPFDGDGNFDKGLKQRKNESSSCLLEPLQKPKLFTKRKKKPKNKNRPKD